MKVSELDAYFRSILDIDGFASADYSLNGLQVGDENADVTKAAFAVDACLEVFQRAAEAGAQLLFVHHGIFWGRQYAFSGAAYKRMKALVEHDLALYAVHLPLDMHSEIGNNAGIMRKLGINDTEPFGLYKGKKIGYKGSLDSPANLDEIVKKLGIPEDDILGILPFGKEKVQSIAVVSGGAVEELDDAVKEGLDLYITGESAHRAYHTAMENSINMISAGHYATETFGVRQMADRLRADTDLDTVFIDFPTGL